jgi:hypothetical protein
MSDEAYQEYKNRNFDVQVYVRDGKLDLHADGRRISVEFDGDQNPIARILGVELIRDESGILRKVPKTTRLSPEISKEALELGLKLLKDKDGTLTCTEADEVISFIGKSTGVKRDRPICL